MTEEKIPEYARVRSWELALVAVAALLALLLGFSRLGAPSLWHDEAVQVLVAKNIVETGHAVLPSGRPHPVAPVFNAILAAFIALFGDAESVVRAPSVLFGALNVALVYVLTRPLLGRATALLAAFALALSPWSLAWSRQARFYAAQQTFYLLTLCAAWRMMERRELRAVITYGIAALIAYLLGVGTSLHSVLFLGPVAAYALALKWGQSPFIWPCTAKRRDTHTQVHHQLNGDCPYLGGIALMTGIVGALTVISYWLTLPEHDATVVFGAARPEIVVGDPEQTSVLYYFSWLRRNLSSGFLLLAMVGFVLMLAREGRRGAYAALAFWVPILALSFVIAYRRHRFMYFAFPIYTMAFSYGLVMLIRFLPRARRSWLHALLAAMIVLFVVRLSFSAAALVGDSIEVARGGDTTLATRHPQYRKPALYVRDHRHEDTVVIADTYVTALYYLGRVDHWYPSKYLPWEAWEVGSEGLKTTDDLQAYMAEYPKGYFLAEWYRFQFFDEQKDDRAWVNAHMRRIEEACSEDVTVYAWGLK